MTQRQEEMLALLQKTGYVTVEQLAAQMYVSPSSIRRDLGALQQAGLVRRRYGGATPMTEEERPAPLALRTRQNDRSKRLMARCAVSLVGQGNSIFLDGSTSAMHVAECLPADAGLTVVTNQMETAKLLGARHIKTHCTGGLMLEGSAVLVGAGTEKALAQFSADILFFSSRSLSSQGLITDCVEEENSVRRAMLQNARLRVFLCDSSKFGKTSLYRLCTLGEVDCLISDGQLPDSLRQMFPEVKFLDGLRRQDGFAPEDVEEKGPVK